jgi:hypothetical protein
VPEHLDFLFRALPVYLVFVPGIAGPSAALAPVSAAQPAVFVAPQIHAELAVVRASVVAAVLHIVAVTVSAAPHTHLVVSLLLVSRSRQLALGPETQHVLVLERAVSPPPLPAASARRAFHHPKEGSVVLVGAWEQ